MVSESKLRANSAYDNRTYKRFMLRLRQEDDSDIIAEMIDHQEHKIPLREYIRSLYDGKSGMFVAEILQHFPKNQRIEITKNGDMLISGSDPGKHSGAMAKNWTLKPNGTLSIEV